MECCWYETPCEPPLAGWDLESGHTCRSPRRGSKCTGNNNQWSCCIGVWRAVPAPPCCPTYFDRTPLPILPFPLNPLALLTLAPSLLFSFYVNSSPTYPPFFRGYRRATLCPSFFHLNAGWKLVRRRKKKDCLSRERRFWCLYFVFWCSPWILWTLKQRSSFQSFNFWAVFCSLYDYFRYPITFDYPVARFIGD